MNLSKYALSNKPLVIFLILVLLGGGIFAFYNMSKLEDPEIQVKMAMVITAYPGASAHQVELEVTDPLEKAVRSMNNVKSVESRSLNDVSQITVELKSTVPPDQLQQMWDMLRRKVADAQSQMPEGARPSIVMDDFGDVFGMFYAITGDGIDNEELMDYAQLVKRELQSLPDVGKVSLYGDRAECINIEIIQEKMANLGVHPAEVLATLKGQNETVYSGYFESGDSRLRVAVNDSYSSVEDIENLILQGHEDDQLRLCNVARVEKGYEEPVRNSLTYDGVPAIGISIAMQSGADITKLGKQVEQKLDDLKATRIPIGIDFHKVFFQPDRVNDALGTFLINLIESVVIVVLVLMLSMGLRSGLILGFCLAVTVLGSFPFLYMLDGTLQRVSLAALIVAMGMLVDNAIVIIDGILVDMKRGIPKPECLTRIGGKTAMPLLGATLIAILAFFPIFLSPDTAGLYVRDLFIVLAVSLLLSWVLALMYIPIHADYSLKIRPAKMTGQDPFDSKPYRLLRQFLSYVLCHKTMTVCLAIVLLGLSAWCYRYIPQVFFPDMTYDQLYIEYKMPEGTSSECVQKNLADISQYLRNRDDVLHVTTSFGGTPSRYNLVRSIADPTTSYGELIVDFRDAGKMEKAIPELQKELSLTHPEAYVRVKRYNLMYKKYPIEVMFSGPDPAVLRDLSLQAQQIMQESPATTLVTNNWEPMTPTLMVNYNQAMARTLGMSRSDVALSLLSATGGLPVGIYSDGVYKKNIYLKSVDAAGNPIESLDNAPVWSMLPSTAALTRETLMGLMNGSMSQEDLLASVISSAPLNQASNGISVKWENPMVGRYNGQRAIKAQCNNAEGYMTEQARKIIAPQIESIPLPPGYSMAWLGEHQASSEAMTYLFKNLPLAIVLMILILIALFRDFKKPLIILLCQPLIIVGVVFGMLVSGKSFGFVAIVGALGLIGMMIKNGIVLIDEINLQIQSGVEPMKALLDSSSSRFRPVMMASITTIVGMVPLLFDDMFGALAVTIMGGLLVGTLITLIFIPVLYALFFHIDCSHKKEKKHEI